jgi:3-deoxy-manno-octulosonate cytidylyltransferase (CMP-KDO synthetase)
MKIAGIIPARFESTRFPGKPLVLIDGISMIERVYRQCKKCNELTSVIVATDDERIANHVKAFGGEVAMTSKDHQSGTDRCAEVIRSSNEEYDVIVNIQGDEPYIDPEQISLVTSCFKDSKVEIATLIKRVNSTEELFNVNIPKVIVGADQSAKYFSRQAIPYIRTKEKDQWLAEYQFMKHIGIYAYRPEVLGKLTKLEPSALEKAESLEQLRWIENGYIITTRETTHETIAIDTPADLEKLTAVDKKHP